jgi:hypothetical protein
MKQNFTDRQGALDGVEALLSVVEYPARSPCTLRFFSRDCPYRATDTRQVAGDA